MLHTVHSNYLYVCLLITNLDLLTFFFCQLPVEIPASEKCRGVRQSVWSKQFPPFAPLSYGFNVWWWKDGNLSNLTRSGSCCFGDYSCHHKYTAGEIMYVYHPFKCKWTLSGRFLMKKKYFELVLMATILIHREYRRSNHGCHKPRLHLWMPRWLITYLLGLMALWRPLYARI